MIQIGKDLIDKILELYKPEARVLKSGYISFPLLSGKFVIPPCFYANVPLQHATDIEIQLCLNQLAYCGIAEAIRRKSIPELIKLDFFELQKEGMFIIESRKRFRRQIPTQQEIGGEIKLKEWKRVKNLFLAYSDFQFENRSCVGNLELAVVLP
jgi:hypothetical protein